MAKTVRDDLRIIVDFPPEDHGAVDVAQGISTPTAHARNAQAWVAGRVR